MFDFWPNAWLHGLIFVKCMCGCSCVRVFDRLNLTSTPLAVCLRACVFESDVGWDKVQSQFRHPGKVDSEMRDLRCKASVSIK